MNQDLKLNFMKNIDKDYFWLYISSNLWGTHYDTRKKLRHVLMCSFFVQKNENGNDDCVLQIILCYLKTIIINCSNVFFV